MFLTEGTLTFLRLQCPITRTDLRQREMESCNILNCSDNKIIYGNSLFCHSKWIAKRQGHHSLEFHTVHLLEPTPQTQTATAHLQTTWTVYFDGQDTQILPCGKIGGGGGGGGGGRLAHGLRGRSMSSVMVKGRGGKNTSTLLGLCNVHCTGWLRVGTRFLCLLPVLGTSQQSSNLVSVSALALYVSEPN